MSIALQSDSSLPQGHLLVNGQKVLTVSTTSGLSATLSQDTINQTQPPGGYNFRNKIINGNFDFWQRGTLLVSGTGNRFLADRWTNVSNGTTYTVSRQMFALGQTGVSNEPTYFHRTTVSSVAGSANFAILRQRIESVKTLAGKTATLSFWAKADSNKNLSVEFSQYFGTGGTPTGQITGIGVRKLSLTNTWQKFIVTANIPALNSNQVLGTDNNDSFLIIFWFDNGSSFNNRNDSLGHQSGTFDIAQVQLEEGPVATPFEQRPIGTELALCQRYFQKSYRQSVVPGTPDGINTNIICSTVSPTWFGGISFPVTMRAVPAVTIYRPSTGVTGQIETTGETGQLTVSSVERGEFGIGLIVTTANGTGGQMYQYHYTADAEI